MSNNMKTAILEFIRKYNQERGYSPSLREIGKGVGLKAPSCVFKYLNMLQDEGLITRIRFSSRALEVIGERNYTDEVTVVEKQGNLPSVILWQGRRYVFDPLG
ncbi:LexA family protein [Paenibacillus sp. 2RAB27]|uniref:LexA family protein n=1 Tax=Paenibacillus sp. 2RAB27 TaxID=3232991 RepID=UPI003F9E6D5F